MGHDVRLAVRCAMFVWFVLLGAALAEWQALRDVTPEQRRERLLRPLEAPADSTALPLRNA